jgi:transcriptional regulator with XRE-family HTH domain
VPAALPEDIRLRLKEALENEVLPRFGGDPKRKQSEAARALKVTPSAINRVLNDTSGGSMDLVQRVSKFLNDKPEKILVGSGEQVVRKLRELPGFEEAMALAKDRASAEHPGIAAGDLERAADARIVPEPERVSAGLLIHMALSQRSEVGQPKTPQRKRH